MTGKKDLPEKGQLEQMRDQDIYEIEKSDLVDIADIKIDQSAPVAERVRSLLRQVKNPYCYLCNGMVVKVSFSGECSMEDAIRHYIDSMYDG